MDAEELLQRYAAGERDFVGVGLDDVDVSGANLSSINLSRASMNQFFADGANLSGADLSGATFRYTRMPDGSIRSDSCE